MEKESIFFLFKMNTCLYYLLCIASLIHTLYIHFNNSSLHILSLDGVNHLIRLYIRTIFFLWNCFMPSTDVYVQPRVLAVAPENVFFRLVDRRCLWFLRSLLETRLLHFFALFRFAVVPLPFSKIKFIFFTRYPVLDLWIKRTWSSEIRTLDLPI